MPQGRPRARSMFRFIQTLLEHAENRAIFPPPPSLIIEINPMVPVQAIRVGAGAPLKVPPPNTCMSSPTRTALWPAVPMGQYRLHRYYRLRVFLLAQFASARRPSPCIKVEKGHIVEAFAIMATSEDNEVALLHCGMTEPRMALHLERDPSSPDRGVAEATTLFQRKNERPPCLEVLRRCSGALRWVSRFPRRKAAVFAATNHSIRIRKDGKRFLRHKAPTRQHAIICPSRSGAARREVLSVPAVDIFQRVSYPHSKLNSKQKTL